MRLNRSLVTLVIVLAAAAARAQEWSAGQGGPGGDDSPRNAHVAPLPGDALGRLDPVPQGGHGYFRPPGGPDGPGGGGPGDPNRSQGPGIAQGSAVPGAGLSPSGGRQGYGGGCYGCSYSGDYYGGAVAARRPAPPQRFQGQWRNGQWYY
jgi:hypothetical protein